MAQQVYVNLRAFKRQADTPYGKKGELYPSIQIRTLSNGKANSIVIFEESLEAVYQKLKELRQALLTNRDKTTNDAYEQWVRYQEQQS